MKVSVNGTSYLLTDKDLLGSGGQANVYLKDTTAFKIYTDPQFMLPAAKIAEFAPLKNPHIIKPQHIVQSSKQDVGYTMAAVSGAEPLCKLFTRPYREQNGITPDVVTAYVKQLHDIVQEAHDNGILLVDLNEMNFLAKSKAIYAIDVDSWQTPSYKATAIMPSVRDYLHPTFSEGTDWYSFACITFQMYIGVHPFRGKHPTLKGFEDRQRGFASVLSKDVGIPGCCYDFNDIPGAMLNWYERMFHSKDRSAPPIGAVGKAATFKVAVVKASTQVKLTECGFAAVMSGVWYGGKKVWAECGILRVDGSMEDIAADTVVNFNGRTLIKAGTVFAELEGPTRSLSTNVLSNVMPLSTLYDGVVMETVLGVPVAVISPATRMCFNVSLPHLKGYRVLNAKYNGSTLMIALEKNGSYYRSVNNISMSCELVSHTEVETQGMPSLNFVTNANGIVVLITEDDDVVLSAGNKTKIVSGTGVVRSTDKLLCDGNTVKVIKDNTLYTMQVS